MNFQQFMQSQGQTGPNPGGAMPGGMPGSTPGGPDTITLPPPGAEMLRQFQAGQQPTMPQPLMTPQPGQTPSDFLRFAMAQRPAPSGPMYSMGGDLGGGMPGGMPGMPGGAPQGQSFGDGRAWAMKLLGLG